MGLDLVGMGNFEGPLKEGHGSFNLGFRVFGSKKNNELGGLKG